MWIPQRVANAANPASEAEMIAIKDHARSWLRRWPAWLAFREISLEGRSRAFTRRHYQLQILRTPPLRTTSGGPGPTLACVRLTLDHQTRRNVVWNETELHTASSHRCSAPIGVRGAQINDTGASVTWAAHTVVRAMRRHSTTVILVLDLL